MGPVKYGFIGRISQRIAFKVLFAGLLIALVAIVSNRLVMTHRGANATSYVSDSSMKMPSYLPLGATIFRQTQPGSSSHPKVSGVVYRLPGKPAQGSPTYPFRIISISETPVTLLLNHTFPQMSFTTNAKENMKTNFTVNGGPARLYSSSDSNGWNQLDWITNGVETSLGTCSSCDVSVSQLFRIAQSMS